MYAKLLAAIVYLPIAAMTMYGAVVLNVSGHPIAGLAVGGCAGVCLLTGVREIINL